MQFCMLLSLSLLHTYTQVLYFRSRQRDQPTSAVLRQTLVLLTNIRLDWKGLPETITLLRTLINYNCKRLHYIGPWCLYHKTYIGIINSQVLCDLYLSLSHNSTQLLHLRSRQRDQPTSAVLRQTAVLLAKHQTRLEKLARHNHSIKNIH